MDGSSRAQLWLATLGAVVALGAAAVPATIQLLEDPAAPVAAPATTAPAPAATPQEPGVETTQQQRPREGRRDRGGRGG